ncbi:MAG TPA: ribosome biogenesis GTP-binding protein YihA/YsxC [Humidesulfovibrio sp.]|uniref:ribosome biogenesis GTP-binding protein YihA/YsxC n=1 Tax=Humidesulfovibrio sp. TaxID=2910988 RepID=UPI002C61CEF8|nr:ribosome biogenesis GTP-binding protein YihA/YsxC [Humidesulfovibrio sp.]HWR02389.1 ribosome biogenesis GTP-binding protein YihA/YsxC [Humidesulfovibrio sp.]
MNRSFDLVKTAYVISQLEPSEEPQVALAGRSNVGKSSLINCLAGRKALAKVSSTPGKTQSVNFFRITPGDYTLVDLPGYGFARRSQEERAKWGKLIEHFLNSNPGLKAVAVLIDVRVTPQQSDLELVGWLRHEGIPILPVLTKCDKVNQREASARQREWRDLLGGAATPICFSSVSKQGREALWAALDKTAGILPEPEKTLQD